MNVISQLFYVVKQAKHRPLCVDFLFTSQSESIHLFINGDIAENGFNTPKALTVLPPSFWAINFAFHRLHMVKVFGVFVDKEDLSALLFTGRLPHTLRLVNALPTVVEVATKLSASLSTYYGIFAAKAHHLPSGTSASHRILVKLEHGNGITGFACFGPLLTFLCLLGLVGFTALKEWIAAAKCRVSDVTIVRSARQELEIGFAMKATVSRELDRVLGRIRQFVHLFV